MTTCGRKVLAKSLSFAVFKHSNCKNQKRFSFFIYIYENQGFVRHYDIQRIAIFTD